MDKIICDVCSSEMKMEKRLKNYKKGGSSYRRRRFVCPACGWVITIHADGEKDMNIIPTRGLDTVKAIARQESDNRDITNYDRAHCDGHDEELF